MKMIRSRFSLSVLFVPLVLGLLLAGYQGTGAAASINQAQLIMLGTGTQLDGQFNANELTVYYKYTRSGGNAQVSGTVQFQPPILANYSMLSSFELSLVFTDAQGNELFRQVVNNSIEADVNDEINFKTSVAVPPGAAAMSFSYTGQAYGPGSPPTNFSLNPVAS